MVRDPTVSGIKLMKKMLKLHIVVTLMLLSIYILAAISICVMYKYVERSQCM